MLIAVGSRTTTRSRVNSWTQPSRWVPPFSIFPSLWPRDCSFSIDSANPAGFDPHIQMLPSIHDADAKKRRRRQLRSDMRTLSKQGVSFTRAHPARKSIHSGKISAWSTQSEIHAIVHSTPILRSSRTTAPLLVQTTHRVKYPETTRHDPFASPAHRTVPQKRRKTGAAPSPFRVKNYEVPDTEDSRTITSKMKKRRRLLQKERRQQAVEEEPSLGSTRSFASLWTIHSILAASTTNNMYKSIDSIGSTNSIGSINTTGSVQDYTTTIPAEFLGLERMLMLQKEMAKAECRTLQKKTQDEMDVSMLMLPADFLFQHNFEHYAKDRSMENVMRVMKRLVSNAKSQAWHMWLAFVAVEQNKEQFARVHRLKQQKGTELMVRIGKRITMNQLFVGFSTWRTVIIKIINFEHYDSAVAIQKHWRSMQGRQRSACRKYKIDSFNLNTLFMEWQERRWRVQHAAAALQCRIEHRACNVIANALRSRLARRALQLKRMALMHATMEQSMALRVQCAWRKKQGRFTLFLKQRARKALEEEQMYAASDIERVFRGFSGRLAFKRALKKKHDGNKARMFLKRMMNQKLYQRFVRWKTMAQRQATVKRMMKRSLGGKLMRIFMLWYDNVQDIKASMTDAERARLADLARMEELRLIAEENDRRVKVALKRMFNRVLVGCFNSWIGLVDQHRRVKHLAMKIFAGKKQGRFMQWVEWLEDVKEERAEMGQLAWEAEQQRLKEIAQQEAAAEKERIRKLKWAVAKMNSRLISACFCALREWNIQMKGVRSMLIRILQGIKLRLFERWWSVVLDRREQLNTSSAFLRRLMNQKLYQAFHKWHLTYRTACRVRIKFARVLMGKKRYFFEKWNENGLKGQGTRIINELNAIKHERGRFLGLSKGMTTVVHEIMHSGIDVLTWDDLTVLKRAIAQTNSFQQLEIKAALRVQTRWRTRNGQLAYHLLLAGKREKANEELKAVLLLSRVIRGRRGRRASVKMKEQRYKEKMKEKYKRERRQEKEREAWIQETEENEFRESLIAKRKIELKLEAAKLKNQLAQEEAEEQKWKNEQLNEEKKQHELSMAKARNDQVSKFGGWVATSDVRTGDVFYHNELTGASQWEKPAELGGGGGDGSGVASWIELEHGTGEKYFYNTVTGQSSWTDPRKAMMRAPKIEKRRCSGKKCVDKKTKLTAVAVRECIRCRVDFCMPCFVAAHKSKKKNDHRFKPIVDKKITTLKCRDCTAMASRWCKPCDVNFCDNCFGWAHQGGSLALHECQMFVPGSQTCAECENRVAVKECHQCGDPFCSHCYSLQHRSGTKKRHTFSAIEVVKELLKDAEEYCSVCHVRAADRACDPCGDPYCSRCFKETHKTANKKGHTWTPWSKIRTGRDWVQINDEVSGEILYFNVKSRKTQSNKPTGLMSGLERDIDKKRLLAEKEMSARLDKERELIRLRQETTSMSREISMVGTQLEEAQKVILPKRRSFFSSVLKNPKNLMKSRIVAYKIKQENHAQEKEFLRSRLITEERDVEIAREAKEFGSDRHADTVVDQLIGGLKKAPSE